MFSKRDYQAFRAELEPIIVDCFVKRPTKEDFIQNKYFIQNGLWLGTENNTYVYEQEKVDAHVDELLAISKKIPRFQKAQYDNSGTILGIDLMIDFRKEPISKKEFDYQTALANHFINLLCAAKIAKAHAINVDNSKTVLMILDGKYRSFFEPEGQEPADD